MNGLVPTLTAGMDHGNTMPYIVDKMNIVINPMENGSCRTLKNQYQQSGPSNFQRQGTFGATGVISIESTIVAMRGRGEYEEYAQTLEPNYTGCSNTLTSVQKDNLILEKGLTEECNGISSLSRAEQSRAEQSRAEQLNLCSAGNQERNHRNGNTWDCRLELSGQSIPERPSPRERKDMPNTDDGGYP